VLAPRATALPDPANPDPPDQEPTERQDDPDRDPAADADRPLADVVLQAAKAALPADLLSRLTFAPRSVRAQATGRAGMRQASPRHGRPIGARQGDIRDGARLHLLETLKAAAPWQMLRRAAVPLPAEAAGNGRRLEVRRGDFRLARYQDHTQTLTIFVVDASGSSALHRLAEVKGAIELLLADCYVRRDLVALIAFRGRGAELVLPPTHALARARRCLAGLPGGGGTPLAAGLDAGALMADAARRKGQTPILAVLTDGRANVAADGSADRLRAEVDSIAAARRIRSAGVTALLIDTAPRPDERTRRLGVELGARYVPLPGVGSDSLSRVVRQTAQAAT
jgi:magnesium chelatase subunit D